MSRKQYSSEERSEWSSARIWTAKKGYCAYKPKEYLDDAIVILDHGFECKNPMRILSGVLQELLFTDDYEEKTVVVIDFTKLLEPRPSDEPGYDVIHDEAIQPQFGKRMEKPIVRILERLCLRDATLVARGSVVQFLMKLLSPHVSRSLTIENVKRLVFVWPDLQPTFINEQLKIGDALGDIELRIAYFDAKQQKRRNRILCHYCPKITSIIWQGDHRNMSVLLPLLIENIHEIESEYEWNPILEDENGRRVLFFFFEIFFQNTFSELCLVMNPNTKQREQVSTDITLEMQKPEVVSSSDNIVSLEKCARKVGGLILRGKRCVLCRSLDGEWEGMSVPFVDFDVDEDPKESAIQSASVFCEIDSTELIPLPHIPPITIYKPRGEAIIIELHAIYAANPPPPNMDDDVLEEDEDDLYDWYTLEQAESALERTKDTATIVALQTMAYLLKGAALAQAIPNKWGGIFGESFSSS